MYDVDSIIECCEQIEKKKTCHKNILNGKKLIEQNYYMMQLYKPDISYVNKQSIDFHMKEFEAEFNKLQVVKMLFKDGQGSLKLDELYGIMKKIIKENKWNTNLEFRLY